MGIWTWNGLIAAIAAIASLAACAMPETLRETNMTVTRINNFQAAPGGGDNLKVVLGEVLPAMKTAKGFRSYEILQGEDTPEDIVVIEIWDSVEDHQAAAGNIAPEDFQRVMALIAGAPTGAYYRSAD